MADSTVFRTKSEVAPSTPAVSGGATTAAPVQAVSTTAPEVPYLDYQREHGRPHSADYFSIGDTWQDATGGFPTEIGIIEDYFKERISNGEMSNSVTAAKARMKEILKITNMENEERNVVKIGVIAAYIKFLADSAKVRQKFSERAKQQYRGE